MVSRIDVKNPGVEPPEYDRRIRGVESPEYSIINNVDLEVDRCLRYSGVALIFVLPIVKM